MKGDDAFRLGLIGSGLITAEAHLPAAIASPLIEVAAIVDTVPSHAERLAESAGIRPRISTRLEDVLGEIDGALIATPNHTHAPLALECLAAGVPVLVEKPLATSVEEGEAIARAARESQCVAAVGYCTRFLENVLFMNTLLESRFFGSVRRFAYQFGAVGGWSSLSGFHLDRRAVGGGALVTVGTHFLDRMIRWFGYPDECCLEDDSLGGPEANALATFRYASGREGRARFSRTIALQPGFVMETERGTVLLREGPSEPLRFRPVDHPVVECRLVRTGGPIYAEDRGMFEHQLEDFVGACREHREPRVPVEQGVEVIRLVEELYSRRTSMRTDWYDAARRPVP